MLFERNKVTFILKKLAVFVRQKTKRQGAATPLSQPGHQIGRDDDAQVWLGVKEVDEGIWLASCMSYDLGFVDLEQVTLQPLDNPFGARLSPMS